MAKVGEGDPRWLVENRSDGKNLNNWHWAEVNLLNWAKQRLEELFTNVEVPCNESGASLQITNCDSVTGDCASNVRKNKTIFIYDLEVKLKWKGTLGEAEGNGTVTLKDIEATNADDEFEIKVTGDGDDKVKELMRQSVSPVVKKMISAFLKEMKETKRDEGKFQVTQSQSNSNSPVAATASKPAASTSSSSSTGSSSKGKTYEVRIRFNVPTHILYETFFDSGRISAFTASPAQISRDLGSTFNMFRGAVTGSNVEVDLNKKIVQKWRFQSWPENHFSELTMNFDNEDGTTVLHLVQRGIPDSDFERTVQGWEQNFWQRMKAIFGWEYKVLNHK
jgi:activator of HSP90 ATPase